ncbi:hypothetical protein AB0M50_06495 [Nonomuraea fuscirosea]|uniref:hypothetical protein n=1 Tax=Nonomuraea fuscirosea TaxID=1291556 RepID=UPI00341FA5F4
MSPTLEHEYLIELVRNRPSLVTTLLAEVGVAVPSFDRARLGTADFTNCRPTEYRADSVVLLDREGKPVRAVVLEVQRRYDKRKTWSWPVYLSTLRAIEECPVVLLVFCQDDKTAEDCAEPIDMGHPDWVLRPIVAGPRHIPRVTDIEQACDDAELTALSTIMYGDPETPEGIEVLRTFIEAATLRPEGRPSYAQLVFALLPKFNLAQFGKEIGMDVTIEDAMVHPLIRECVEYGEARGEAKGEAKAVLMILDGRNIQAPFEARRRILACTDQETLKTWIERALVATSVDELFD